jgi:hypothetical protein
MRGLPKLGSRSWFSTGKQHATHNNKNIRRKYEEAFCSACSFWIYSSICG